MKRFTVADVQRKYGVSRRVIAGLVKDGFIHPARGERREYQFSFNDVILMRKAQELRTAGISPRKTTRFLKQLSKNIVGASPGLHLSAAGNELVVRENGHLRNADGQFVIDFAHIGAAENVVALPAGPGPNLSPSGWFAAAVALEEIDPMRAIDYYQRAIEIDQKYADAYINLSCLLIEGAQVIEAFAACQEALLQCPREPLLYFNMGVVYEELGSKADAVECYTIALGFDAGLADAHYNVARVYELLGQSAKAIRHYSAYRRLKSSGPPD